MKKVSFARFAITTPQKHKQWLRKRAKSLGHNNVSRVIQDLIFDEMQRELSQKSEPAEASK